MGGETHQLPRHRRACSEIKLRWTSKTQHNSHRSSSQWPHIRTDTWWRRTSGKYLMYEDSSKILLFRFSCARIEVLHGGHIACQQQYNIFPMGKTVHSNAKHFYCSWHATWPPCKTSISTFLQRHFPYKNDWDLRRNFFKNLTPKGDQSELFWTLRDTTFKQQTSTRYRDFNDDVTSAKYFYRDFLSNRLIDFYQTEW